MNLRKKFRQLQEQLRDPSLTALTMMLAVLMFVISPLQAMGIIAAHHFGLLFALVLLVAIFVVSGSLAAVTAASAAIGLIVVATVLRLRQPSILDIYLDASAWMIAGMTLGVVVGRAVFAPGQVTFHRIIGAILLYLNIGLIFMALFCFVGLVVSNAFTGMKLQQDDLTIAANLVYFSFTTLTSVGYGDIVPLHPFARSLANIEAIIGQLYPATLLARLVTLELEGRRRP